MKWTVTATSPRAEGRGEGEAVGRGDCSPGFRGNATAKLASWTVNRLSDALLIET